jgi:hypothetical protein
MTDLYVRCLASTIALLLENLKKLLDVKLVWFILNENLIDLSLAVYETFFNIQMYIHTYHSRFVPKVVAEASKMKKMRSRGSETPKTT